jgi:hypothetical protein
VSTELTAWAAPSFDDCIREARVLKEDDVLGAYRLIKIAAVIGISDLEVDVLLKEISRSTGLRISSLRNAWGKARTKANHKGFEADAEPEGDQRKPDGQRQADVLI